MWYLMKDTIVSSGNPLEKIPKDVSILVEIDRPGELYELLESENAIWNKITMQ